MHDATWPLLLPRVQTPTLIVWGREDQIIPLECGELYKQGLKNSQLAVLDRCGHYPHLEKSEEFGRIASTFLLQA